MNKIEVEKGWVLLQIYEQVRPVEGFPTLYFLAAGSKRP